MERLTKTLNVEFAAALLRSHGFIMKEKQEEQTAKGILEAAKQAGHQLIQEGQIKPEMLKTIKQQLISLKELHKIYEKAYEKAQNLCSQQT